MLPPSLAHHQPPTKGGPWRRGRGVSMKEQHSSMGTAAALGKTVELGTSGLKSWTEGRI